MVVVVLTFSVQAKNMTYHNLINPFDYNLVFEFQDKFKREYRIRFKCCFKDPSPGTGDGKR